MFHLVYRTGVKLLSNWEKACFTPKVSWFYIESVFLACEFVFYREEHNAKRGNSMELNFEALKT